MLRAILSGTSVYQNLEARGRGSEIYDCVVDYSALWLSVGTIRRSCAEVVANQTRIAH